MKIQIVLLISVIAVLSSGAEIPKETYSNNNKFPSQKVCGRYKMRLDTAIVGGRKAELGDYPWMANIGYKPKDTPGSTRWNCGGTLITDQHILTAAHCLHPDTTKAISASAIIQMVAVKVRLGDLDIDPKKEDGATPQFFDIEQTIYHEKYSNKLQVNDIGLIKLKTKVTFTDLILPICLPPQSLYEKNFVGEFPKVIGWGANMEEKRGETAIRETNLMELSVLVRDSDECRRNITSAPAQGFTNFVIDNNVMCAGITGKDSCQGDSGGPLMYSYQTDETPSDMVGNWFQIGVVSYGYGCGRQGYPGVYTRVSSFMKWVNEKVQY